ncbi:MAG: hypothetical protein IJ374_09635 [Lachnospiraceae bacterium]|nr:hypothetical protein [Lachnospiraceae bacterium]
MALYTPVVGIITEIDHQTGNFNQTPGCNILYTLQTEGQQGIINFMLQPNAYVLNLHPFQIGDRATFFYDPNTPVPLIYPPRYQAIAAAYTPHGVTAVLDVFQSNLVNSDNTLMLTPMWNTPVTLPNGQPFTENAGGNLLLATYTATTRSIPARTTPEQIVVFCGNRTN